MNRSAVIVGSAVVVGCVLVGEMVYRHTAARTAAVEAGSKPDAARAPAVREPLAETAPAPAVAVPMTVYGPAPERVAPEVVTEAKPAAPRPAATVPAARRAPRRRPPDVVPGAPEPVVPVEVARVALAYVGADPEAEAVWYTAINDPSLSAHARQDLIEDLNEDGFADPRNVTADELPLVVSRLELIEEAAPYAMDQVNADAFAEAYKDLANMYVRLTGGN
jgi:hypothetical protein